jgi:hypothetical protein
MVVAYPRAAPAADSPLAAPDDDPPESLPNSRLAVPLDTDAPPAAADAPARAPPPPPREAGVPRWMTELHTYADGDFWLSSRAAVDAVRAYPELPLPVLVDSFLTVAVSAAGYAQRVFMPPACVFHQFHPQGAMPQRVTETVTPEHIAAFIGNVTTMLRTRTPIVVNGPDWGYAEHSFREERVVAV